MPLPIFTLVVCAASSVKATIESKNGSVEGIYLAVLTALDALRRETGRPVEPEHVLHEDLVPA